MNQKPLIIYDGNCTFCKNCLSLIEEKDTTGFEKIAFQALVPNDPLRELGDFNKAVYLVEQKSGEQQVSSGAQAIFRMLHLQGISSSWLVLYENFPPFKFFAIALYVIIAKNRATSNFLLKQILEFNSVGKNYSIGQSLFFKILSTSFVISFLSWAWQFEVLWGENGLIDLNKEVSQLRSYFSYLTMPNFLFLSTKYTSIYPYIWGGIIASFLSYFNFFRSFFYLASTLCYLTILHSSSSFGHFQWDTLLVEAGFLAALISLPYFSKSLAAILVRLLAFKIIFLSGFVKLAASTEHWRNFSALFYHFETQPIPTPLSYLFHAMPSFLLVTACVLVLFIQLVIPFFLFYRKSRNIAAIILIAHQFLIALTGNYNFFNLLTVGLLLVSLENRFFRHLKLDFQFELQLNSALKFLSSLPFAAILLAGHFAIYLNIIFPGHARPAFPTWYWMNSYGLFSNITTERVEIIIEISHDRQQWEIVDFPHKIDFNGDSTGWVAPYQPRIDWQLWFAALAPDRHQLWFLKLLRNILDQPDKLRKHINIPLKEFYFIRTSLQRFKLRSDGSWQAVGDRRPHLEELSSESFKELP